MKVFQCDRCGAYETGSTLGRYRSNQTRHTATITIINIDDDGNGKGFDKELCGFCFKQVDEFIKTKPVTLAGEKP